MHPATSRLQQHQFLWAIPDSGRAKITLWSPVVAYSVTGSLTYKHSPPLRTPRWHGVCLEFDFSNDKISQRATVRFDRTQARFSWTWSVCIYLMLITSIHLQKPCRLRQTPIQFAIIVPAQEDKTKIVSNITNAAAFQMTTSKSSSDSH